MKTRGSCGKTITKCQASTAKNISGNYYDANTSTTDKCTVDMIFLNEH